MVQRILVVDEDRELVRLVRTYLEQSDYEVLTACDGETALRILRRERPDLMILDLMLSERDGWDMTHVVRGDLNLAALPIVMLTARVEDQHGITELEAGADDRIARSFNPHEVVACVQAVLRRMQREPTPSKVIQAGQVTIDLDAHQVEVGGQSLRLTPTEFALLRALAEHPGHALTRLEMIEEGAGVGYEGLERTVDSHVKNLRRKLDEVGEAAHLIETVFGVGYRLVVERDSA